MSPITLLIILFAVSLNALAQLLLKNGTTLFKTLDSNDVFSFLLNGIIKNYFFLGGFLSYLFSIFLWVYTLSKVEVSIAYPMLSLGFVINALGAWYFLGESMSFLKIIGITLILLGCFTLFRSS